MTHLARLVLAVATAAVLTACGSTVPLVADSSSTGTGTGKSDKLPDPPRPCCVNPNGPQLDPLDDRNSVLHKRSIYFNFNDDTVREEFRPLLEAHAVYLVRYKSRKVQLSGHADERGSREYNLAIGFKRAEAVRKMLETLGVPAAQLESVSYGEEKPKANGMDEASWAENRRVDLEYR